MSQRKHMTNSFIELNARERVKSILDPNTFRELCDPFCKIESPHLPSQGIVPQSDDGVVVGLGTLNNERTLSISTDGKFMGGGIGEVSGAKIAAALELALQDNKQGIPTKTVLMLETGGIRLQESNYGLLALAEIQAAIIELRQLQPVVCVIAGTIGCFGGMSITAGLCTSIIMTKHGRLQLNGPEVIEQEAGIEEFDSRNRPFIWSISGGEQRVETGLADKLVHDDVNELREQIIHCFNNQRPKYFRSTMIDKYVTQLNNIDPSGNLTPDALRGLWGKPVESGSTIHYNAAVTSVLEKKIESSSNGKLFFQALVASRDQVESGSDSVLAGNITLGSEHATVIAVVPNRHNRFHRARNGQLGVDEGWALARCVRQAIEADQSKPSKDKSAIVAIVDVPGQAYGYKEDLLGIHQSLAAAVDAYATARLSGHPIVALIVGQALSGAFLAHGLQANAIIALNDPSVMVQVMSKKSISIITKTSLSEVEHTTSIGRAHDISSFTKLGAVEHLIDDITSDQLTLEKVDRLQILLHHTITKIRSSSNDLSHRLSSHNAQLYRSSSIHVRKEMEAQWS